MLSFIFIGIKKEKVIINHILKKILLVLNIQPLKHYFRKHVNENSQTSLYKKNCQNYFFKSMSNIKNFDPNLLSIDQISFKSTDCVICDIKYFKNLDSSNSLYLLLIMQMHTLKKIRKINT